MDLKLMQRALELARAQNGRTGRNPSVGCVLIDADGQILSEAATGDGGRPHAEQQALRDCVGHNCDGGTAYVTLEPCHLRSTGEDSCALRLLHAGFRRIVVATRDRHPQGRGGLEALKAGGAEIVLGVLQDEAEALYADFFARLSARSGRD